MMITVAIVGGVVALVAWGAWVRRGCNAAWGAWSASGGIALCQHREAPGDDAPVSGNGGLRWDAGRAPPAFEQPTLELVGKARRKRRRHGAALQSGARRRD